MIKNIFQKLYYLIIVVGTTISLAQADSEACRARLSVEDQKVFYNLALDALKESLVEMNAESAAMKVEDLRTHRPQIIHVIGNDVKKTSGRLHVSLCYYDHSHFLKCSEVFQQLKEKKKLVDFYTPLLSQPLKPTGVSTYGKFIGIELDPKSYNFEDQSVTTALHISVINMRNNDDLNKKICEKLAKKVSALSPIKLERATCRKGPQHTNMSIAVPLKDGTPQPLATK